MVTRVFRRRRADPPEGPWPLYIVAPRTRAGERRAKAHGVRCAEGRWPFLCAWMAPEYRAVVTLHMGTCRVTLSAEQVKACFRAARRHVNDDAVIKVTDHLFVVSDVPRECIDKLCVELLYIATQVGTREESLCPSR